MSSAEPSVRGVVIAHGTMAQGLVDAVRSIAGAEADALVPVSNQGLSPETLAARLEELVGEEPAILFVDLQAGSCGFLARRICREHPRQAAVFGVNLPQLLDFVTHRHLSVPELVQRALERGRAAIRCAPAELEEHADPSLSRG